MRFEVLGPVQIRINDDVVTPAPKPRALLAVLLAARGRPVTIDRLLTELWPDGAPSTAAATLQMHVSALRKVVGDRVTTAPGGYRLDLSGAGFDAAEFEDSGDLGLWRGDAYENAGGGKSVEAAAARLGELRLAARQQWARQALDSGRHVAAATELAGWVAEQPTDEGLVRQLMLALYRSGRAGEALATLKKTTEALAELGAAPGTELEALAAAIRRQDPTLDRPAAGLPAQPNRFIGRRAELDRAITLLGTARLLTIAGPGGAGKTRLSLELAREMAADHDAVHVVELAEHRDGPLNLRLAAALGVREEPGVPVLDTVTRWVNATGRVLIVLDNCEHVRPQSTALAHALTAACPGLRLVATSREPLGLSGEVVVTLGGLATPPPGATDHTDAVRLLADRVSAARGGAGLTPAELTVAAELCRRLDGLPLAIELAAARLRALPLSEIMSRLDRRLDLLTGVSPVARHQTMRAAIDWGYELLDTPQQDLLRRLGVLAGGFDLATAAALTDSDPLDPLTQLVDRSMVQWQDGRYRLIETIREFARERLVAEERVDAYTRLVLILERRLAEPPPMDGPAHTAWVAGIGADHDTIVAAIDWSLTEGDAAKGLTIAAAMWWYWWVAGRMAEGLSWLGRALDATPDEPTALRGRSLRAAAALARNSGDLNRARQLGEQCLATFRAVGDRIGVIAALNNLLITAQAQEDYPASLEFGYEALRIAEEASDARMVAAASNNTAGTLRCMGRLDEAEALFARGLDGFRALNDQRGVAAALSNLSTTDRRRGRYEPARLAMREALEIYTELGIVEGQLDAIEGLAQLDVLEGDPAGGLGLLVLAERERSALGAPSFTPDEIADREQSEAAARAALGGSAVAAVYRAAAATTLPETVAALLRGAGEGNGRPRQPPA
ncbi:putative ATPase/DNA-binding SARP family transcriptional activator [Actinoplanes lutulentus]|uniref:Putative ATPase n=1 Tax=Actinoplanes lutulentus TaxID=1287878 RepID=A0A327Z0R9_9ACTN|nr:BTAD domain-containing putative transcriptional regulator [Actinoplanes lutulentus]MBB2947725.1 putative ATPase/DNA-binding SARP family transcriptional activator [Actinoplanes lutulentus]RAK27780.1 putative ATPase [Actinoplanes lutulentus]